MTIRFWRNVVLVGIVTSAVLPMIPVLVWAFAPRWPFPDLIPGDWSLRGWVYIASPHSHVVPGFSNSLLIALVVTLLGFPIGIPAARALGLYHFRGKRVVEFLLLAPLIVPELPVAMGIHILFIKCGSADSRAAAPPSSREASSSASRSPGR